MTTFKIDITQTSSGAPANTPRAVLAQLDTHDPTVAAATLRAVADRLDPPKPVRPVYRSDADRRAEGTRRHLAKLAGYGADGADGPYYAHDADCNTIHEAGPEECPPPRIATPAEIDAMVCPDCTDERHTYEPGRCALKSVRPQWVDDGVRVDRCRGGACDEGHTYTAGCLLANVADRYRGGVDTTMGPTAVVDDPGARMDAPDAVLSPAAAEAVARVKADEGRTPRRTRITPDGCGPEHTFTGSCTLTPPHRD